MKLLLKAGSNTPRLADIDNFSELDVHVEKGVDKDGMIRALGSAGHLAGGHAWLVIERLLKSGSPDDADWCRKFYAMIDYASSAGWVDDAKVHVRAHIVGNSNGTD